MQEWVRLLEVVRTLPLVFTAGDLAREARLVPTAKLMEGQKYVASGNQKASAFLARFCKLGYVRRVGVAEGEGKARPAILYEITPFGKTYQVGTGTTAKLIAAVGFFAEQRGQKHEERAFKALMQAHKEASQQESGS